MNTLSNQLMKLARGSGICTAIAINAISGVLLVGALVLHITIFSPSLKIALALLFGPLIGFLLPSIHVRFEFWLGKMLGGRAKRDGLYRLITWALFPTVIFIFTSEAARRTVFSNLHWVLHFQLFLCVAAAATIAGIYLCCLAEEQGFRLLKSLFVSVVGALLTLTSAAAVILVAAKFFDPIVKHLQFFL